MIIYTRRDESDKWHWCTNCPRYPGAEDVKIATENRPSSDLCDQCEQKEQDGSCVS